MVYTDVCVCVRAYSFNIDSEKRRHVLDSMYSRGKYAVNEPCSGVKSLWAYRRFIFQCDLNDDPANSVF